MQLYSLNPFNSFPAHFPWFLFSFLVDGLGETEKIPTGLEQKLPMEISDLELSLLGESMDIFIQP